MRGSGDVKSAHWSTLSWQAWLLGIEASSVIATRLIALSTGGEAARREFDRMINEKTEAAFQLQAKLMNLGTAVTPAAALDTTIRHYRRKVAANRRRLSQ